MITLLTLDYEEIVMVCTAFAAFAYVIADARRERKLDAHAIDFAGRLGRVEADVSHLLSMVRDADETEEK